MPPISLNFGEAARMWDSVIVSNALLLSKRQRKEAADDLLSLEKKNHRGNEFSFQCCSKTLMRRSCKRSQASLKFFIKLSLTEWSGICCPHLVFVILGYFRKYLRKSCINETWLRYESIAKVIFVNQYLCLVLLQNILNTRWMHTMV